MAITEIMTPKIRLPESYYPQYTTENYKNLSDQEIAQHLVRLGIVENRTSGDWQVALPKIEAMIPLLRGGASLQDLRILPTDQLQSMVTSQENKNNQDIFNRAQTQYQQTGSVDPSLMNQLPADWQKRLNDANRKWSQDQAAVNTQNALAQPTTTQPETGQTSQTPGLTQQGGFPTAPVPSPTTQQYIQSHLSQFQPENQDQARGMLAGEMFRLLGNLPQPQYYPGQTFAGLTPEQIKSQEMLTGIADTMGGDLTSERAGIGSLLGQLDPNINPYLKTASGNVDLSMPSYKSALDFAGGDPTISKDWQGMGSRSGLEKYTSGEVSPYLTQLFNAQYNPLKQDLMDTSGQMMSDYERRIAPILEGAKGLSTQATRNFLESINPAIKSSANQAGQFGSTKQQIAQGLAATRVGEELARQTGQIGLAATLGGGELSDQLAQKYGQFGGRATDVLGNIVGTEWGNAQNRGLSAAGTLAGMDFSALTSDEQARAARAGLGVSNMGQASNTYGQAYGQGLQGVTSGLGYMPQYYSDQTIPAQIYAGVGGQNQNINQMGITDAIHRYDFGLNAPFYYPQMMSQIMGMSPQTPQQVQPVQNPYLTALGGTMSGMGGMMPFIMKGGALVPGAGPYLAGAGILGGVGGYLSGGGRF